MKVTHNEGDLESSIPSLDFREKFGNCSGQLLKRCHRILNDHGAAEETVHDTYVRAYKHWAQFDGRNFDAWVSRISERLCIDRIRSEHRAPSGIPNQFLSNEVDPSTIDTEMRLLSGLQIRAILSQLPDEQRQCLKLFYIDGYSANEVAEKTDFSPKQVKSYLQNGRRNFLRKWKTLEKEGHG